MICYHYFILLLILLTITTTINIIQIHLWFSYHHTFTSEYQFRLDYKMTKAPYISHINREKKNLSAKQVGPMSKARSRAHTSFCTPEFLLSYLLRISLYLNHVSLCAQPDHGWMKQDEKLEIFTSAYAKLLNLSIS